MALAAVPLPTRAPLVVRRFELPDLTRHAWIVPRIAKAYPHLTERTTAGWLTGLIYSSEYLFLYQEHAVALAQLVRSHTLSPAPVVHERFVFAESEDHMDAAAEFYTEFARWAKHHGARTIIVEELSDVLHEKVREKLGT